MDGEASAAGRQPTRHKDGSAIFDPLYSSNLAQTEKVETPINAEFGRLRSIVDDATSDASIDTYLLVEVPFKVESEAVAILGLADSLQQRLFMHATNVEMRSTVVRTIDHQYNSTLVVTKSGATKLKDLYGNGYESSDTRVTEQQCAHLFESEFELLASTVSQFVYSQMLPVAGSDTDESSMPPYVAPNGIMTIYFVDSRRGHEMPLTGSSLTSRRA